MEPLDDSILDEFLVDSHEGLDRLDRDLVMLEHDPASGEALASAFRSLHTIKGTCSFFGFRRLERVAHAGEHVLSRLRSNQLALTPEIAGGLLAVVDSVRGILAGIESTRQEPAGDDSAVLAQLAPWLPAEGAARARPAATSRAKAVVPKPAPAPSAAVGAVVEGGPATPGATTALQQQHLRVDVRRLDQLMDLVGELVLARNQLVQTVAVGGATPVGRAAQRLDQVTTRLQDEVMRTRMQPVSALWARLPRLVRDVATACGKPVRLELEGNATELDRTLVEALKDPLTHLLRNAVDHGIEDAATRERAGKPAEGVLRLRAFEEGGSVHLLLSDDGGGMSLERIRAQAIARGLAEPADVDRLTEEQWLQFVFRPGFSTAKNVTNISGRGVGLDAARSAIESVGGGLEVSSVSGQGTTFHVRIPLTLAIIPALTVEQAGECYVIPQAHLLELARLGVGGARVEWAHDRPRFRLRGELLPVVLLGRLFDSPGAPGSSDGRHLLVLSAEGQRFGLVVDQVRDTEEIVVKPLRSGLREIGPFAGATVRGDGRVALILDVLALAAHAGLRRGVTATPAASATPTAPARRAVPLLLVRSRGGQPAVVPVAEVERIVEFESSAFERLDERPAVRFEGTVLPVTTLAGGATRRRLDAFEAERAWPVLIHERDGQRWGFLVDTVLDIVDWPGAPDAERLVVRDHVTDYVSLARAGADAFAEAA